MNKIIVEIIVTNVDEAIEAQKLGANRLELIHAFSDGGLSPELTTTREVCSVVDIPVSVMVRPHAKNFVYDKNDMKQIQHEIDWIASQTRAANIVFGSLTPARTIAFKQLEDILAQISLTKHLGLTYHRAIDEAIDTVGAFNELQSYINTPLKRVLSSGGKATAFEGVNQLRRMQGDIKSNGVKLLIGSGVTPVNAAQLIHLTGVDEIHLGTGVRDSAQKFVPELFSQLFDSLVQKI